MASPLLVSRLPTELYHLIISKVANTTALRSLALTSRAFALAAEPRLYASLKFTHNASSLKLARTLVQSPRKSQFVFAIEARLFDVEMALLPAGMKLCLQAIVGCPNLTSLSTSWRPNQKWVTRLLGFNHFQLYRFVSWFQWDEGVCRFLETQPSLVELEIVRPGAVVSLADDPGAQLSRYALPRLSKLMGRLPQAAAIVPGRPVSSLSVYGAVTLTNLEAALPMLARTSVPMDTLSLQTGELSSTLLTLLSAYLPNISFLEIRIVRHSMVAYSDLTSESLCQAMSSLTRLRHFALRLRCPQLFYETYFHTQRDVILDWKNRCPTLTKVIFESSSENKAPEWTYDEEAMDWMCSLDE